MKQTFLLSVLIIFIQFLSAKTIIDFGKFPFENTDSTSIHTEDFLKKIKWNSIKKYCNTVKGQDAKTDADSFLTT